MQTIKSIRVFCFYSLGNAWLWSCSVTISKYHYLTPAAAAGHSGELGVNWWISQNSYFQMNKKVSIHLRTTYSLKTELCLSVYVLRVYAPLVYKSLRNKPTCVVLIRDFTSNANHGSVYIEIDMNLFLGVHIFILNSDCLPVCFHVIKVNWNFGRLKRSRSASCQPN